jgi:hypothetical protein
MGVMVRNLMETIDSISGFLVRIERCVAVYLAYSKRPILPLKPGPESALSSSGTSGHEHDYQSRWYVRSSLCRVDGNNATIGRFETVRIPLICI